MLEEKNMAVTAALVKELRERTSAGMMECKKALVASNGDIEAAIEAMRKSGQAKAAKKAGRTAAEGVIRVAISEDAKNAIMVEINCETDFVSRDESFKAFTDQVAQSILKDRPANIEDLGALTLSGADQSLEESRLALVSKVGENVQVRRFVEITSDGTLSAYTHGDRIGVLVAVSNDDVTLARDIAMHIAASNPQVVYPEDVSAELVSKEKEIFTAKAAESGKPAEIVEKMVTGQVKKFLNEVSLVGQPFVKNPDQTVGQLLESQKAQVTAFERFEVGEGIEKKEENFAEEVMAQVRGE